MCIEIVIRDNDGHHHLTATPKLRALVGTAGLVRKDLYPHVGLGHQNRCLCPIDVDTTLIQAGYLHDSVRQAEEANTMLRLFAAPGQEASN